MMRQQGPADARMAPVAILPAHDAAHDRFERYAALVRQAEQDPALRADPAHCVAIARAWAAWRDLFIAWDRPR